MQTNGNDAANLANTTDILLKNTANTANADMTAIMSANNGIAIPIANFLMGKDENGSGSDAGLIKGIRTSYLIWRYGFVENSREKIHEAGGLLFRILLSILSFCWYPTIFFNENSGTESNNFHYK